MAQIHIQEVLFNIEIPVQCPMRYRKVNKTESQCSQRRAYRKKIVREAHLRTEPPWYYFDSFFTRLVFLPLLDIYLRRNFKRSVSGQWSAYFMRMGVLSTAYKIGVSFRVTVTGKENSLSL